MKDKNFIVLFFLILVLAFCVRFFNLRVDPSILLDSGQVGDEGYWLYNARNLKTFGHLAPDEFYHDFAAAPLFSAVSFLSFSFFGVGFWQARILSALSGFFIVLITYKIARPMGEKIALVATFLISINTALLLHNRLAVPESLSILFMALAVWLWTGEKYLVAGAATSLALLSKTTAFLFLPSMTAIIIIDYFSKKIGSKDVVKFLAGSILVFLLIAIPISVIWGNKVILIYSTFAKWYYPGNSTALWTNVINFFTHPFWGSPFVFPLVILSLVNIFATYFKKLETGYCQRVSFYWLFGAFILTPFMSQVTNARLLPLLVPLSILSAQTIILHKKYFLKIKDIQVKNISGVTKSLLIFLLFYPLSVLIGKFLLAIAKRVLEDEQIVYQLPIASILLVFALGTTFNFFYKKKAWDFLIKFNAILLIALPAISFVPTMAGLMTMFKVAVLSRTEITILEIITAVIIILSIFSYRAIFNKSIIFFSTLYLIFSVFGLVTIFLHPSFNLYNASRELGKYADNSVVIGFLGHELAIQNRSKVIYFAPRLNFVSGLNQNYLEFNPKILLVPDVFDNQRIDKGPWLTEEDIQKKLIPLGKLDFSRQFLTAKREVKIKVYEIAE
ncbi:MAG: glycosyltransferase family 39 protein [Candidatus Curtissbacteria bacterium]|nr:glycosyltransferase family 39 protein [Candidatus Curtissbacteria bacterium]